MNNPYAPPPARGQGGPGTEEPPRRGRPGPRETRRTGHGQPREPAPRPSPEQARTASRRTFAAVACTVGVLLVTAFPLPWPALGLPLSLAALVLVVRAFIVVRAARLERALVPVLAMTMVIALFYVLYSSTILATWPLHQERQECLARALTVSARDACNAEFQDALDGLRPGSD